MLTATPALRPCPGRCGNHIVSDRPACRRCWQRLPQPLRASLTTAYAREYTARLRAVAAVNRWYADPANHRAPTPVAAPTAQPAGAR